MNERILSRQEARQRVYAMVEAEIVKAHPYLSRKRVRQLARQSGNQALRETHGAKLVVRKEPANAWQGLKQYLPDWLTSRYPVQYVER